MDAHVSLPTRRDPSAGGWDIFSYQAPLSSCNQQHNLKQTEKNCRFYINRPWSLGENKIIAH